MNSKEAYQLETVAEDMLRDAFIENNINFDYAVDWFLVGPSLIVQAWFSENDQKVTYIGYLNEYAIWEVETPAEVIERVNEYVGEQYVDDQRD